jgi:hypothetical protein
MIFNKLLKKIKSNCCCPHSWVVVDSKMDLTKISSEIITKAVMKLDTELKRTWLCTQCHKMIELSCLNIPVSYVEKSE